MIEIEHLTKRYEQKAAAFALTDPEIQQVTANMLAAYARRRNLVLRIAQELESEKVLVTPPQGAFYFFLDFRPLKMTSLELCERLLEEAGTTPPGADGVVFLPYLAGERSPIWDPSATGAFVGLTLAHGRGHLARAILEASALAIRHVAEPMLAAGVRVTAMRACGGPARSEMWNQIKTDVTGFPVLVPAVLETAVLGSAMLGAVAIGACPDVPSAVRSMTRIERRLAPRPDVRATYDRAFDIYTGLYPALRPVLQGSDR